MRFELRIKGKDASNYPHVQKSNNERPYGHINHTTKREQSIPALALHHLISLGLDKKVPTGNQDKHAARSFSVFHERGKKGREGRVDCPATKRAGIFWLRCDPLARTKRLAQGIILAKGEGSWVIRRRKESGAADPKEDLVPR